MVLARGYPVMKLYTAGACTHTVFIVPGQQLRGAACNWLSQRLVVCSRCDAVLLLVEQCLPVDAQHVQLLKLTPQHAR
jgi:hypothetical protein